MSENDAAQNKKKQYPGHKPGETPRRMHVNGRTYDVEMMVYRRKIVDLNNYDEQDHLKLHLTGFGEAEILYSPKFDVIEFDKTFVPKKAFSEM